MKQELSAKIEVIKTQVALEEKSYSDMPKELEEIIGLKKKIVIEALNKQKGKLENELNRILAAEEKERREAPVKALMAKINDANKVQKELKAQLERAKALAKQNPKDQEALVESLVLANKMGDVNNEMAKLKEEQTALMTK